jgi:hypothetical protein
MFRQKEIKCLRGFKTIQQRLKTKSEAYKTSKCVIMSLLFEEIIFHLIFVYHLISNFIPFCFILFYYVMFKVF